jgi:hypothetical protein
MPAPRDSTRSGELRTGDAGATVLVLSRRRFAGLYDDNLELRLRVMQNLARSLSLRLRWQNWQVQSMRRSFEPGLLERER